MTEPLMPPVASPAASVAFTHARPPLYFKAGPRLSPEADPQMNTMDPLLTAATTSNLSVPAVHAPLNADSDPAFDEIVQLAAQICETPVALVALIHADQLKLKARHGLAPDSPLPRIQAFCAQVIAGDSELLTVLNANADPCFTGNLPGKAEAHLRFYAGVPLTFSDGNTLGTLCVLDEVPRQLRPEQAQALQILGKQVIAQLELQRTLALRLKETEQLRMMDQALNACSDSIVITDARQPDNPIIMANPAFERITGYTVEESLGRNCRFLYNNEGSQLGLKTLRNALRTQQSCRVAVKNFRKDGRPFWNELHVSPVRDATGCVTHYIGVQSDITARKESEDAMRQRDAILEGVSFAAETLLNEPNLETALPLVLDQIGESTGAKHVCLWQRKQNPAEPIPLALKNIWCNPHYGLDEETVLKPINWDPAQGWPTETQFRIGRIIQANPNNNIEEINFLAALQLGSLLCLPIYVNHDNFWGILTVACPPKSFTWGFVEIEALRSAVRILGAVINNRETDAALRQSEERFRTVVTNLKEVVFKTDTNGLWSFLNPAWTEITGFNVDESLGTSFLNYVHPEDREASASLFDPLIEWKNDYCRYEARFLTQNTGFHWIEVFARQVLDTDGSMIGITGTLNDVTNRKQAEDALQKQRIAIEAAIDGVALLDDNGRFTYLNQTHVEMFGYHHPDELLGQSRLALYSDKEIARFENEVFPQLKTQGKWRGTMTATRRDGNTFAEEISLTQVEGGGLVCVCRDITDRINAEQFILNSLQEKEVMLKEIHHRVKNNMQIVSSLLNLQLEHLKDEEARIMFAESQNRIASMALVHEKLYQSTDLARIDFTDYLSDLTDNLVSSLGAHMRNIVFKLNATDLHLGIDTAIPCGLIINELVSNAYKHGFPQGGPGQVGLDIARLADGRIRLEVSDTGRGIAAHINLQQTKSLGMQLVHTLVRQLRGTIEVQREGGTHFILHLQESKQKEPARS